MARLLVLAVAARVAARRVADTEQSLEVQLLNATGDRSCLCIFDVDRTLTAKQWNWKDGKAEKCPGVEPATGGSYKPCKGCDGYIRDQAYSDGPLTLGQVGLNLQQTFCGQRCYVGIVSAGWVSGAGSEAREVLLRQIPSHLRLGGGWADDCGKDGVTPLMLSCHEGIEKYRAAEKVQDWFSSRGAKIPDDQVFFFDDKRDNVGAMDMSKHGKDGVRRQFNAFEISCGNRNRDWGTYRAQDGSKKGWHGTLGRCGATMAELAAAEQKRGVHMCPGKY